MAFARNRSPLPVLDVLRRCVVANRRPRTPTLTNRLPADNQCRPCFVWHPTDSCCPRNRRSFVPALQATQILRSARVVNDLVDRRGCDGTFEPALQTRKILLVQDALARGVRDGDATNAERGEHGIGLRL